MRMEDAETRTGGRGERGGDLDWNVHAYGNGDHDICPKDKENIIEE
jgi:hypothetical protein